MAFLRTGKKQTRVEKSKQPANTAFKQQRLPAWQPLLTPRIVLPALLVLGIVMAPIGGIILMTVQNVTEIVIDYTGCDEAPTALTDSPHNVYTFYGPAADSLFPGVGGSGVFSSAASVFLGGGIGGANTRVKWATRTQNPEYVPDPDFEVTQCVIRFPVPKTLPPPIMLYIRLTNFYQNHRRYVASVSASQLEGEPLAAQDLTSCDPVIASEEDDGSGGVRRIPYYPCGLVANSLFNDSITSLSRVEDGSATNMFYDFAPKDIAWPADEDRYKETKYNVDEVRPPPNWQIRYPDGKYQAPTDGNEQSQFGIPPIHVDQRFQNWMRTAALPTFRKPWGRNATLNLEEGTYQVVIDYNFQVKDYGGTKAIVISTISPLGGRNPFLGVIYIATSVLCIVLAAAFTARHFIKPRRLGDHSFLSWNQPSASGNRPGPRGGAGDDPNGVGEIPHFGEGSAGVTRGQGRAESIAMQGVKGQTQ